MAFRDQQQEEARPALSVKSIKGTNYAQEARRATEAEQALDKLGMPRGGGTTLKGKREAEWFAYTAKFLYKVSVDTDAKPESVIRTLRLNHLGREGADGFRNMLNHLRKTADMDTAANKQRAKDINKIISILDTFYEKEKDNPAARLILEKMNKSVYTPVFQ